MSAIGGKAHVFAPIDSLIRVSTSLYKLGNSLFHVLGNLQENQHVFSSLANAGRANRGRLGEVSL